MKTTTWLAISANGSIVAFDLTYSGILMTLRELGIDRSDVRITQSGMVAR